MSLLRAAQAYLALGFHPIPVQPPTADPKSGKAALVQWREYIDTAPTPEEIDAWWAQWPDANIALLQGRGTFVLDVDGDAGFTALREHGIELDAAWPYVMTGKGRHYYFRGVARDRIGVLPKVDVRSRGGYVVAPPSMHHTGLEYRWSTGAVPPEFPDASPELLEFLGGPTKLTSAASPRTVGMTDWPRIIAGVGEGERNASAARIAGRLWGAGLYEDEVQTWTSRWNEGNKPPLSQGDIDAVVRSICSREGGPPGTGNTSRHSVIEQALDEIFKPATERRVCATDIAGLDRAMCGGLEPGTLTYVAALPGVGKTALVLQIARRAAKRGVPTLVISREMRPAMIYRRLWSQATGVALSEIRAGTLNEAESTMIRAAAASFDEYPLDIVDIRAVDGIKKFVNESKQIPGLVIVDYLQKLHATPGLGDNKRGRVEYASQTLKEISVDLELPVLCVSALRRLPKDKLGNRLPPSTDDLRESGELEFDADNILIMERAFGSSDTTLTVAKARDGRVSEIALRFFGDVLTFREMP